MTGRVPTVPTSRRCVTCGYAKTYRTPAMAAHHFGKHSCEKYLRAAEQHARGLALHAAVDRTPKACRHPIADHQHGTYAAYTLDRCRCLPCAQAAGAYERARVKRHAYGRFDSLVPAGPVREHVRSLMAAGVGWKRVAAAAGVPVSCVSQLVYGKDRADGSVRPLERIKRVNAEKLLAVRPDARLLAGGALVDAVGTRRRLQALVAAGWSLSKLGERIGVAAHNMSALIDRAQVTVATARAVGELYDQLWDVAPPDATHHDRIAASRSRNLAARRGYAPPLAWDDESIDDPAAEPINDVEPGDDLDEVLVERLMAGTARLPSHSRSPELVEAVRRLAAAGYSDADIGHRVSRRVDAVLKMRHRNDIQAAEAS